MLVLSRSGDVMWPAKGLKDRLRRRGRERERLGGGRVEITLAWFVFVVVCLLKFVSLLLVCFPSVDIPQSPD